MPGASALQKMTPRQTLRSIFGIPVPAVEAVPLTIYGDSYGNGTQGADQASRPFDRIARRQFTQTQTNQAVAGTRMDQIAAKIATTWTPNSRGLVGFSAGMLNDVFQYGDTTGYATTKEAFRTSLAYLTAEAVSTPASTAFSWGTGWSAAGVSSTTSSVADAAFTGSTAYLLVAFVTGSGGTVVVKEGSTTLATITTGGYKQNFTGAVKLAPGTGAGTHQLTLTLTAGSATIMGIAVPSPTPPVIVWDKPGQFRANSAEYTLVQGYLAQCAGILSDFPTVVPVDVGSDWNYATMISEDTIHRNDAGNAYVAARIEAALAVYLASGVRQGLNRISGTLAAPAYITPVATAAAGAATVLAADSFTRSTLGSTESGGYAWTQNNSSTSWSCNGTQLVSTSVATQANDCFIDDGTADGTIKATRVSGSATGIVFRASGTNNVNGYIFWANGSSYTLSKRTGLNSYTSLSTVAITPAANDVIGVILSGTSITPIVNGAAQTPVVDATYTGTRHGVWVNVSVAGTFDDFVHTTP